jgi:hypothetical protein
VNGFRGDGGERGKNKEKGPSRKNDLWAPNLVSGFIVLANRPVSHYTSHGKSSHKNTRAARWTEPRHAAFEVSRWIYGYGRYLHRSLSNLKPFPFDPVASKPSPPNIQNVCSPVCAGVVVQ